MAREMKRGGRPAVYEGIVAFHDCDPLGIVWHGNYYRYLEHGRTELFRSRRIDVRDLVELGYKLVVIESRCRHAFPLRYSDRFRVEAWFKEVELGLTVSYLVTNLTQDRRAARGTTKLVVLRDDEMLMETPHELVGRIRAAA
jgi:acyl-CoA thioester hydrolase